MDINSLLNIFKSVDKNNDLIISEQELKNSNIKGSVWESMLKPDTDMSSFLIQGLTVQHNNENSENISSFDKMHSKLVSNCINRVF